MSSGSVATAIVSWQLGGLMRLYSEQTLLRAAFVLYACSTAMIPLLPNVLLLFIPAMLFGAAMGLNVPSVQTLLAGLAPKEHRGAFMSLNGMVFRLGQTLGPLLMGMVFGLWGMDSVFYAGAVLALTTFAFVAIGLGFHSD